MRLMSCSYYTQRGGHDSDVTRIAEIEPRTQLVWLPTGLKGQKSVEIGNRVTVCSGASAMIYFVGFATEYLPI